MGALLSAAARALAAGALLFAGAAVAQDDPLDTVRAALRQFGGTTPVKAALERDVTAERKDRPREAGHATLEVSAGPRGISVGYPSTLLAAIRAEQADTDPEKAQPAKRTLEGFDATDVADLLNSATGLLSDLDGATVRTDSPVDYHGQPARLLDLDLVPRISRADSKWLKKATRSMRLWVAPDGVPLAQETVVDFSVGLLMFHFDGRDERTRAYERFGDRLVAVRASAHFDGEGLGESTHTGSDIILQLLPGN